MSTTSGLSEAMRRSVAVWSFVSSQLARKTRACNRPVVLAEDVTYLRHCCNRLLFPMSVLVSETFSAPTTGSSSAFQVLEQLDHGRDTPRGVPSLFRDLIVTGVILGNDLLPCQNREIPAKLGVVQVAAVHDGRLLSLRCHTASGCRGGCQSMIYAGS